MKRIEEILENYQKKDGKIFHDTLDELCGKGIAKGCYQDITVLYDVINILSICESIIESKDV